MATFIFIYFSTDPLHSQPINIHNPLLHVKIVCRCEDITEEDIIKAIEEYGCETLAELKQLLRLGMGHCQGRTCLILAAKILARKTGKNLDEILPSFRPPVVPVEIGLVGGEDGK